MAYGKGKGGKMPMAKKDMPHKGMPMSKKGPKSK